jgi:hypothetical protein
VKINSPNKIIKMKKLMFSTIAAFSMMLFLPTQLKAETETGTASMVTTEADDNSIAPTNNIESADASSLSEIADFEATNAAQVAQLEEIKAMDLSTLSRSEKMALREEVKTIQNDRDQYRRRDRGRHLGRRHHHNDYDGNYYEGRHSNGVIYVFGGGGLLLLLLILLLI